MEGNLLYYGDNLDVLRRHIADESVDLVYLDPPFKSNQDYNVLFAEQDGSRSAAQIKAFEDTWRWDESAAAAYDDVLTVGGTVADALVAFRKLLGDTDMLAYLSMMAPRLVELQRVLKPGGGIYLHCDSAASAHLRLLVDAIFEPKNFRNEIIWRRYGAHNDVGQGSKHFGRVHDVILFYSKGAPKVWNQLFIPLGAKYIEGTYRQVDPGGRRYTTTPLTGPGGAAKGNPVFEWKGHTRAWRYSRETFERLEAEGRLSYSRTGYVRQKHYLEESKGVPVQDVWDDIPSLSGAHKERLGYPTQKPEALLERIILASTNSDSVVLDPFCGCGTTISVAQRLDRRWIGIDITHLSIGLIKSRLADAYSGSAVYKVIGEPTSVEDAAQLAKEDPFQFQAWALGLVGARHASSASKGADRGIDGRLYFNDGMGETKQIILSVKAGQLKPDNVTALSGVVLRESAQIGALISFQSPTQPMRSNAASAGFYESPWGKHPRVQLLTVRELLEGGKLDYPRVQGANVTYKKAQAAKVTSGDQLDLVAEGGPDEPYGEPDSADQA